MQRIKKFEFSPEKYNQIKEIQIEGRTIQGSLSPFDFPREATAVYDDESKDFRILFSYLTPSEPRVIRELSNELVVYLGESSGKLYEILIRNQEPAAIEHFKPTLFSQVEDLAHSENRTEQNKYVQELNLRVAKEMLEQEPELFSVAS
jgi:hypothetical protein